MIRLFVRLLAVCTAVLGPAVVAVSSASPGPVVNTTLGPIQGVAPPSSGCAAFYGVPYAAAPVGPLRFKPPAPAAPWSTVREATRVGASCMQTFGDAFMRLPLALEEILEFMHLGMEKMSEDCLFLNVFAPPGAISAAGKAKLPVLVWIHGGSYLGGSGDLQSGVPFYDGKKMCGEAAAAAEAAGEEGGGVILVTVNYRLGFLGFLAHDELLAESKTAGNMGIQDQRAALEFVAANAAQFGGDPSKVTLFGESAGGASVVTHLTAKRSAHLFRAGIVQSGGLWLRSYERSAAVGAGLASIAGCPPGAPGGVIACLRKIPATKLVHLQIDPRLYANYSNSGPCADGFEFPRGATSRSLMASGDFAGKPVMVGTNRNESGLFRCFGSDAPASDMTEAQARAGIAEMLHLPSTAPGSAMLDGVMEAFNATEFYGGSWRSAFIDVDTAHQFTCDAKAVLDATAAKGLPAFEYLLVRPVWFFKAVPCFGVPHLTDVFYLFGNFDAVLTSAARSLGRQMRRQWVSFASTLSPGNGWPSYAAAGGKNYLELNAPPANATIGHDLKRSQCKVLDAIPRVS